MALFQDFKRATPAATADFVQAANIDAANAQANAARKAARQQNTLFGLGSAYGPMKKEFGGPVDSFQNALRNRQLGATMKGMGPSPVSGISPHAQVMGVNKAALGSAAPAAAAKTAAFTAPGASLAATPAAAKAAMATPGLAGVSPAVTGTAAASGAATGAGTGAAALMGPIGWAGLAALAAYGLLS